MSKEQLSEDQVTRLPKDIVQVGVPLKFPVYDAHGQLLMQIGTVVSSEDQLERLYDRGLYLNKKTSSQLLASKKSADTSNDKKAKEEQTESAPVLVSLPLQSVNIGTPIQISPLSDNTNSTKYRVKFLGGLEKSSIICTAPTIDEKSVFIKEHSGFSVQIFSGKEVYNFITTASAVLHKPFPHIHLKYPQGVYSKNIRNNQRVESSIICSLVNHSANETSKSAGKIVDISLGGAMVESNTIAGEIKDEIECIFKLALDDTETLLSLPCVLRNVIEPKEDDDKQKYSHGIQFKEIPFLEKAILQNYIYQLLTGKDLNSL